MTTGSNEELQRELGISFKNPELIESAFTHRSYRSRKAKHYERLEFLGDAVLDLVVSEWIMNEHPEFNEGELSQLRAQLVNRETLSSLAQHLRLDRYLRMGRGESNQTLRGRQSILADVFEALIGAMYLDNGFELTRTWVVGIMADYKSKHFRVKDVLDYKSILQEWTQSNELNLPVYTIVQEDGPDHNKWFRVMCELRSGDTAVGEGFSKKQAEQKAAQILVEKLGIISHEQ